MRLGEFEGIVGDEDGYTADSDAAREKIAQLSGFIARFSAGTRASQVGSRRKEVERLQTTDLARSNIQRPFIRFKMSRPSGVTVLEFGGKGSCSSAATAKARPPCSRPLVRRAGPSRV
jgi:ATPase subunit of ABC transporter with duplicated ATPase domains